MSSSSSEHDDRARKQAEAQLETVVQYVHRLRHIEFQFLIGRLDTR